MLFEIIILFEVVAFLFLGLGIMPFKQKENKSNPYLNKILFVFIAAIVFFSLALWAVNYEYTYCYINETVTDFTLNSTLSTATCDDYMIESVDLSYLNWGMGIVCIVLFFVLILFATMSRYENEPDDGLGF